MKRKRLLQLLHAAFADTQRPARPLTTHRCWECDEVDSVFGARTWQEVAAEFPPYCHDTYSLLSDAAKAYFLPAYLIAALGESSGGQGGSMESELRFGWLEPGRFSHIQRLAVLTWATTYWRQAWGTEPPAEVVARWCPR